MSYIVFLKHFGRPLQLDYQLDPHEVPAEDVCQAGPQIHANLVLLCLVSLSAIGLFTFQTRIHENSPKHRPIISLIKGVRCLVRNKACELSDLPDVNMP